VIGTGFVMGVPLTAQPSQGRFVLITAAHVLEGIQGDIAILHLRRRVDASTNLWAQEPVPLQIRANGKPIWKRHPDADVAAMYIRLPPEAAIPLITSAMLADDKMLSDFEIHPGDEVKCLGFPLGVASNDAGFPVLRSGMIASYPLVPTATTKTFLFDFRVFKGNSGGPVYYRWLSKFSLHHRLGFRRENLHRTISRRILTGSSSDTTRIGDSSPCEPNKADP
jgi:S1-C subfamily serine protease